MSNMTHVKDIVPEVMNKIMSKAEFQKRHGFDDEDMKKIGDVCKKFNGQVVSVSKT